MFHIGYEIIQIFLYNRASGSGSIEKRITKTLYNTQLKAGYEKSYVAVSKKIQEKQERSPVWGCFTRFDIRFEQPDVKQ